MTSKSYMVHALTKPSTTFAVVLLLVTFGLMALRHLPVQAFPTIKYASVEVDTVYYGADPGTIEGFLTSPLEQALSPARGVDYITSSSKQGESDITLHLALGTNPAETLTEVQSLVNAVLSNLPSGTQSPAITLDYGDESILDLALTSDTATAPQISEYAQRVLKPEIITVPGVRAVEVNDSKPLAMRLYLDPVKLASFGLTPQKVRDQIAANSYVAGVGSVDGKTINTPLTIESSLKSAEEFGELVVSTNDGAPVHINDIGHAEIGTSRERFAAYADGIPGVFLDVVPVDGANIIAVANAVKSRVNELQKTLPSTMSLTVNEDDTEFTNHALHEVLEALVEALFVVSIIVFIALGNVRSAVVPVVAVPLALLGSLWVLDLFGFSINELTLLALVLAVGLVVDDAIIIVERHERHLENGLTAARAAKKAVEELLKPIISMTIVLAAAYLPVALLSGIAGILFREFAATLVAAVTVSAIVAVTVSPVLCALLVTHPPSQRSVRKYGDVWTAILDGVKVVQSHSLKHYKVTCAIGGVLVLMTVVFFVASRRELAPQEDQGYVHLRGHATPSMSFSVSNHFDKMVLDRIQKFPYTWHSWNSVTPSSIKGGISLIDWRNRPGTDIAIEKMRTDLRDIAGFNFSLYQSASLPTEDGDPVELVVEGGGDLDDLIRVSQGILKKMKSSGLFAYVESNLQESQQKSRIVLDRAKLADMKLDAQSVADSVSAMLSGSYVNYFNYEGRSYKVITSAEDGSRLADQDILNYPIASVQGQPILVGSVAHLESTYGPDVLRHFQGLRAVTISAELTHGVSQGKVATYLHDISTNLPRDYTADLSGPIREYVRNQSGYAFTLLLSIAVVYLTLASFYGSLTDPIIILVSVPTSLCGALFFVWLGVGDLSINLYTDVGLLTLVGLITKHGILLVEVANEAQDIGKNKYAAILIALRTRLRPILMTSGAMIIGSLPLVIIGGPGHAARSTIGLIIITGLGVGTTLTLLVVPAFYMLLSRDRSLHRVNQSQEDVFGLE